MKNRIKLVAATLFLVLFLAGTNQVLQAGTPGPKGNPAPEKVKKLWFLTGSWKGKATMTQGAESFTFDYFFDFKKDADGWGLSYHERGVLPGGMAPYQGFGVFTYDATDDMMHIFTCSNYGDVHDHKGKWIDDKHFVLQYTGLKEGKQFVEDLSITITGNDSFKGTDVETLDGVKSAVTEFDIKRVK